MTVYGYPRVSSLDQDLTGQIAELRAHGAIVDDGEKVSGRSRDNRSCLQRLLDKLQTGDVVLVTRLDRLARSTRDLLNIIAEIHDRGARFRSIADQWADTTTPHGQLLLTVLGGLAEFERSLIAARVAAGRERAIQKGVHFGPRFKMSPTAMAEALRRKEDGEPLASIAAAFSVSVPTISALKTVVKPFAKSRRSGSRGFVANV